MTLTNSRSEDLALFCEAEYPRLAGALTLYCGRQDVAEEMTREALARACQDWAKVQEKDSPRAWLYAVAFNLTRSYFRRKLIERLCA